jgi:hypothetical protein
MKALDIIKNVYFYPAKAFGPDEMESTFEEAVIWYVGLIFAALGINYVRLPADEKTAQGILLLAAGAISGMFVLMLTCWLVGVLMKKQGVRLDRQPLFSGILWAAIALLPIQLVLQVTFRPLYWLTLVWFAFLVGSCIRQQSRLMASRSFQTAGLAVTISFIIVAFSLASVLFLLS